MAKMALRSRLAGLPSLTGFFVFLLERMLIYFINPRRNRKCEQSFCSMALNDRDDVTFEGIVALSEEPGPVENLRLSGGEPFRNR